MTETVQRTQRIVVNAAIQHIEVDSLLQKVIVSPAMRGVNVINAGPIGPAGPAGAASTVPGPEGPEGPQGPQGVKGDTGSQGPQGVKGDTGAQGPKGDTGAQGPAGAEDVTVTPEPPPFTYDLWVDSDAVAPDPNLYANIGGVWTPISTSGSGTGADEVFVGPADPGTTAGFELWVDTDATAGTEGGAKVVWDSPGVTGAPYKQLGEMYYPQAGSPFQSYYQWQLSSRIVQRFADVAARDTYYTIGDAGIGAVCTTRSPTPAMWLAVSGTPARWVQIDVPTDWTNLPLQGVWTNYAGWQTCQYRKEGDRVYLRGVCSGGAIGNVAVLPIGFRPPANVICSVDASNSHSRVDIRTDGTVYMQTGTLPGWLSLDGISFSTSVL